MGTGTAMPESAAVVAALVDGHRRFLAFLERRVGSREVAEDILQEAFVRGFERAGQLRDEEAAVAWFYRLLRNAIVDHWRRQASDRRARERAGVTEESAIPAEPDDEAFAEICACLRPVVETLKPEYAEAIRSVDLERGSVSAFAEKEGITANNASVRLHRARLALRRGLERSCGTCAEHGCLDCSCGRPGPARPTA